MWMVIYPILRHASCVGNFAEISDLVLAKARSSSTKFSFNDIYPHRCETTTSPRWHWLRENSSSIMSLTTGWLPWPLQVSSITSISLFKLFLRSRLCLWSRRGVQILRLSVGQVLKTVWAESPLSNCLCHEHRVQPRHCQVILVIALGKEAAQFENFFVFSEIKRFSKKASDSSSAGDPDKITTWAWTLFNIKFLSIVFQFLQWPMIRTSQSCQLFSVQAEIDQVKDIMVANIDVIIERGEKLELLVDKTEHLATNSITFRWLPHCKYVLYALSFSGILQEAFSVLSGGKIWSWLLVWAWGS